MLNMPNMSLFEKMNVQNKTMMKNMI